MATGSCRRIGGPKPAPILWQLGVAVGLGAGRTVGLGPGRTVGLGAGRTVGLGPGRTVGLGRVFYERFFFVPRPQP